VHPSIEACFLFRLKHTSEAEYEHGIFQNIGLKGSSDQRMGSFVCCVDVTLRITFYFVFAEFHNYLTAPCDATDTKRDLLFKQAIRRMNERTFQYAKKQRKEVRLRIVNSESAEARCWHFFLSANKLI